MKEKVDFKQKHKKTILVTGGAGFIGTNLLVILIQKGFSVIVIDNFSNSKKKYIEKLKIEYNELIKIYEFDLLDQTRLEEVFNTNKIDAVVHLAGKKYIPESFVKEKEYYENNITVTRNILDLMEKYKIKKLVFPSSISVYGNVNLTSIKENQKLSPLSPYAIQKKLGEEMISDWQQKTDYSATILRLSNPIGANTTFMLGDDANTVEYISLLPYIVGNVKAENKLIFNGNDHPTKDGTTVRDYIHVEDVAKAFVYVIEENLNGFEIFNIGSGGEGFSVLQILNETEKYLNKKADFAFGVRRSGDASTIISDNRKAKNFGFIKKLKPLYEMVSSYIDFSNLKD